MRIDVLPSPTGRDPAPEAEHELRGLVAELALRGVDALLADQERVPGSEESGHEHADRGGPGHEGADRTEHGHGEPDRTGSEAGGRAPVARPGAEALLLVEPAAGAPLGDRRFGRWLERARAAADAGRPVVVSGLTLGPGDAAQDEDVRLLLSTALLVGLRDAQSLAVARRLCPEHPGLRVGRQDALLLPRPTPQRPPVQDAPAGAPPAEDPVPPRIVAVVERPGGPFPAAEVARVLADVLDALVHRTGGTVVLQACGGTADEQFAAELAARLSDDVRTVPPGRDGPDSAALRADWVVTTCPHGAALGSAVHAVVLPVAPGAYSLDGMEEVLAHWGLAGGVVPLAALLTPGEVAWDTRAAVQQWATEAVEQRGPVRAALADAEPAVREASARWWEELVAALHGRLDAPGPEPVVAPRGVGAPVAGALRRRYTVPEVPPERPTVAVLLAAPGGPAPVRRAVEDLLAQTFTDWRLVLVQDGGDPAAPDEALAPRRDDVAGRVTVLHHRRSLGRAAAVNRGLRAVDSELVVRHHGAEHWPPTLLQRAVAHLENALVTDDGVVVEPAPGAGTEGPPRRPVRGTARVDRSALTLTDVLDGDRTAVDAPFVYRRAVHGVLGDYDESVGAAEGWEFALRFLETFTVGVLPPVRPGGVAGGAVRGELTVRERHLRQWSAENGIGLPLYLRHAAAQEAAALHERLDAADGLAHELLEEIRAQSRRLERLEHALAERGVAALWRRARRRVRGWLGRAPNRG